MAEIVLGGGIRPKIDLCSSKPTATSPCTWMAPGARARFNWNAIDSIRNSPGPSGPRTFLAGAQCRCFIPDRGDL